MSWINQHFDEVFVINLHRRIDRRICMLEKLNALKIKATIFEAFDGRDDQIQKEFRSYFEAPVSANSHPLEIALGRKSIHSSGAWAYLLTWERLLKYAIANNLKRILCFDDDVIFSNDFFSSINTALSKIPAGWKSIHLGASQHTWEGISMDCADRGWYSPIRTDGSFAIALSRSAFWPLLHSISKMNCAFDSGPLRDLATLFPENCFVLFPNQCIADVTNSDIQGSRDQEEISKKFKWDLSNFTIHSQPKNPIVSIIMPAYNAASTISASISSIQKQSIANFELVVIDDGSSDTTRDIVQTISQIDTRVQLLTNDTNKGCYYSRNKGLLRARANIIMIQDADDIASSGRIAQQIEPILLGKARFTLANIIRSSLSVDDIKDFDKTVKDNIERVRIGYNTFTCTRSLFDELGYFAELRFAADREFLERALARYYNLDFNSTDAVDIFKLLSQCDTIPGLYSRINDTLIISPNMTSSNISNQYKSYELEEAVTKWRKQFVISSALSHIDHLVNHKNNPIGAHTSDQTKGYSISFSNPTELVKVRSKKIGNKVYKYANTRHIEGTGLKGFIGSMIKRFYNLGIDCSISIIPETIKRTGHLLSTIGNDLRDVDRNL